MVESAGDRLATVRDPQIAEFGRRGQAAAAAAAALAVVEASPRPWVPTGADGKRSGWYWRQAVRAGERLFGERLRFGPLTGSRRGVCSIHARSTGRRG